MVDARLYNSWVFTGREGNDTRIYRRKESLAGNTDRNMNKEEGFEIKENGEFIKYKSSDGTSLREVGRYEVKGNTLYTYFENHYQDSMYNIVLLEDNVLKIR